MPIIIFSSFLLALRSSLFCIRINELKARIQNPAISPSHYHKLQSCGRAGYRGRAKQHRVCHHDASKTCHYGAKATRSKEASYEATFNSIKNALLCTKSFFCDVHVPYQNALSPSPWINSFCSDSDLFFIATSSKCTSQSDNFCGW